MLNAGDCRCAGLHLPRLTVVVATVGALLMFGAFCLASLSFANGHHEACKSRGATLNVVEEILRSAQSQSYQQQMTPAQAEQVQAFYKTAFARIRSARC